MAGFTDEQKILIRERDSGKCQLCKILEEKFGVQKSGKCKTLEIHHLVYRKEQKIENGILLCLDCHEVVTNTKRLRAYRGKKIPIMNFKSIFG